MFQPHLSVVMSTVQGQDGSSTPLLPPQREGSKEDRDAHLVPQLVGDREDVREERREDKKATLLSKQCSDAALLVLVCHVLSHSLCLSACRNIVLT